MSPELNVVDVINKRATMLRCARDFFYQRGIVEVDTPVLSKGAPIDVHIDLMRTECGLYLHSSPEYGMKQLLCNGSGDIYQLSHVFRAEEKGRLHNPEFTMVEWYRLGFSFEDMMCETLKFVEIFLGQQSVDKISYYQVFKKYLDIDYRNVELSYLIDILEEYNIPLFSGIELENRDSLLNIVLGTIIEPLLGKDCLTVLYHYPASQSALSQVINVENEGMVSERFEVYYNGIELANGYHELTDHEEQRRRLEFSNTQRKRMCKNTYPIDENFLEAIKRGLPDCCGVAVGFDRLLMLHMKLDNISDIL